MWDIRLKSSWMLHLNDEVSKDYIKVLMTFLDNEELSGNIVYPKRSEYFRALDLTPFDQVKVVVLGQDPYHGPNQAHGLCFSVMPTMRTPPSLHNIYKELKSDLGLPPANHGFLESWAQRGVLLLNSVLTVRHKYPASHTGKGWEKFTSRIIAELNEKRENLVFILWGAAAQKKGKPIDELRHLVLKSVHPSPLSAYRGFFGSKPFSQANNYLINHGIEPVDWTLPVV